MFGAETDFVGTLTRTQLNGADDIPALKNLQGRYKLIPLSRFSGTQPPKPAPPVNWPAWDPGEEAQYPFSASIENLAIRAGLLAGVEGLS